VISNLNFDEATALLTQLQTGQKSLDGLMKGIEDNFGLEIDVNSELGTQLQAVAESVEDKVKVQVAIAEAQAMEFADQSAFQRDVARTLGTSAKQELPHPVLMILQQVPADSSFLMDLMATSGLDWMDDPMVTIDAVIKKVKKGTPLYHDLMGVLGKIEDRFGSNSVQNRRNIAESLRSSVNSGKAKFVITEDAIKFKGDSKVLSAELKFTGVHSVDLELAKMFVQAVSANIDKPTDAVKAVLDQLEAKGFGKLASRRKGAPNTIVISSFELLEALVTQIKAERAQAIAA